MITRTIVRIWLVLLVLGLGGAGAYLLSLAGKPAETSPTQRAEPLVSAITVEPADIRVRVISQGTIQPQTETQLVAEVAGVVTWVAPSFEVGGFFKDGDELLRIDPRDYRIAVIRAKAQLAKAQLAVSLEQAEAESSIAEWTSQSPDTEPPALVARIPQIADAKAQVEAASADVERAERDLDRTTVVAPYDGRVRSRAVDRGQYVSIAFELARVYSSAAVEVRLPLSDSDLAALDLPLDRSFEVAAGNGHAAPPIEITALFADQQHSWQGHIVRTEGELDQRSRLLNAVARVDDPYANAEAGGRPPLLVGMFIRAELPGRVFPNAIRIPRTALQDGNRLLVIDADDRMTYRDVELLRRDRDDVVVRGEIAAGERVCLVPPFVIVDGMQVRVEATEAEAR